MEEVWQPTVEIKWVALTPGVSHLYQKRVSNYNNEEWRLVPKELRY